MMYYYVYPQILPDKSMLSYISFMVCLVVWSLSQGGLGACAFLGTRVAINQTQSETEGGKLASNNQEKADITDANVPKVRIILGCLFGSLVGLPVSQIALTKLNSLLFTDSDASKLNGDIALILVPFMVGFSTSLVLAILDKIVLSLRSLFGIESNK